MAHTSIPTEHMSTLHIQHSAITDGQTANLVTTWLLNYLLVQYCAVTSTWCTGTAPDVESACTGRHLRDTNTGTRTGEAHYWKSNSWDIKCSFSIEIKTWKLLKLQNRVSISWWSRVKEWLCGRYLLTKHFLLTMYRREWVQFWGFSCVVLLWCGLVFFLF